MTGVLVRRDSDTDNYRGQTTWRHTDKTAVYKPGQRPQKKPTPLASRSQTSSLQNCERMNLGCLSLPICITLLWQPWAKWFTHCSRCSKIQGITPPLFAGHRKAGSPFWSSWPLQHGHWAPKSLSGQWALESMETFAIDTEAQDKLWLITEVISRIFPFRWTAVKHLHRQAPSPSINTPALDQPSYCGFSYA